MLQQDLQTPKGQKEDDRMHDIASPSIRSTAGSTAGERRGVVVVGGGISGLALGAWLAREDVDVLVLEREERPGGVIDTFADEGFLFERGPNTIMSKHASLDALLEWAGLAGRAAHVALRGQTRHIWLKGRLHEAPSGPVSFLTSGLLPLGAKLAPLREPFVRRVAGDESVAAFIRRRLGEAWLRNLVSPFVSGIWAGDPEQLSAEQAFPMLKRMEREAGSLIRGMFARKKTAGGGDAAKGKRRPREMVSFAEGLGTLPRGLAARLGERYRGGMTVRGIEALAGGGFAVRAAGVDGAEERIECERVVLTTPAKITAELLEGMRGVELPAALGEAARALRATPHATLAIASVGIESGQACVPKGFGFLVPRGEGVRILGAITASNFIAGRAPAGCAALSVFIGGALDPEAAELDDAALRELVLRDLGTTIGLKGAPRVFALQRWRGALPQYDLGHAARVAKYAAAEASTPGLHLAGNWRGGTALAERIEVMRELAEGMR